MIRTIEEIGGVQNIKEEISIPGSHIELMDGVRFWNRKNEGLDIYLIVEHPWGNDILAKVTPDQVKEIATWEWYKIFRYAGENAIDYPLNSRRGIK